MKIKKVMSCDASRLLYRIGRIVWQKGCVGDGKGFSAKISLALTPLFFKKKFSFNERELCIFGVRIHYVKSYGGILS